MRRALAYQPTLFDVLNVEKKEAVVLDMKQARVERNKGIEKAVMHADQQVSNWSDRAYGFLLRFLSNHNGAFMAEEVRSYAVLMDFEMPPHNRAWGGIMLKAAKAGIIERCGIQKVKNKKAHCANAALWRQVKQIHQ